MIKIYMTSLNFSSIDLYRPYFSQYRKERLQKTKNPLHFAQAEATEALLCYGAAKLGYSLPLNINVRKGGKPYAKNLNFSISHSGDKVLLALSDTEIGADIQKINYSQNLAVAKKILIPAETEGVDTYTFFRYFTMKESYFKMTGEGLPLSPKPFNSFEKCFFKTWEKDGYMISVCQKREITADIEFVQ